MENKLKKILMIATGGTIASEISDTGLSPSLTTQELLSFVPEINEFCTVTGLQLMNIDSTNVSPCDWLKMAQTIKDNYDLFDGFVICHGTDTMAYTAAVLSYLIQKSPKPIVITGSQKPIEFAVTDAKTNLHDSFLYASSDKAFGVNIVFDGKVIVGTKAKKTRTKSYNAFSSINYPYVARIQDGKIINYLSKPNFKKPVFYSALNEKVGVYKLIPGANAQMLDHYFSLFDAVVIESFGTGGIPDGRGFYEVIDKWQKKGKILVMTTQVVNEGSDMTVYKVGKSLKERYGFLEAYDMTFECTVTKLMWITAFAKSRKAVEKYFYKNIANDILYKD